MCTAIGFNTDCHYFGRNLDLDMSYGEEVCIVPRSYPLIFRKKPTIENHYAFIGMATVVNDTPLFYDGANEHGLAMAGLNFPKNAFYAEEKADKDNICQFEFIPYILGQCKNLAEAKELLKNISIVNISFSENLPVSPLHWIISDKSGALTVEQTASGLFVYENPVSVLTNNPPFPYQLFNLNNYRNLKVTNGENSFADKQILDEYCQGLGAIGLPGDISSMSRFVRAVFAKENSACANDELSSVSQFFHLLTNVEMCRGVCVVPNGKYDITVYSSCINADKGLYYYTTYDNRRISCIDMHKTNLNSDIVSRYPLDLAQDISYLN